MQVIAKSHECIGMQDGNDARGTKVVEQMMNNAVLECTNAFTLTITLGKNWT